MRKLIIACVAALLGAVTAWAGASTGTAASATIPVAGGTASASVSFTTAGQYLFAGGSRPDWITGISVSIKSGSNTFNLGAGNNNVSIVAGGTATIAFTASANTTGVSRSWTYVISSSSATLNVAVTQAAGTGTTTYTITYKPGSLGTGSQQTQTKYKGVSVTLKDAIFTRAGYTQTGWTTYDGGSKMYSLGAAYTADAALTLYPVWTTSTSGLPNFVFYQVSGWPSAAFLTSGTTSTESLTTVKQGDPLYVRYGYINGGTAAATACLTHKILFDGSLVTTKVDEDMLPVGDGHARWNGLASENMSIGTHTLRIVLNPDKSLSESDYTDNERSLTFTVTAGETTPTETKTVSVSASAAGGSNTASLSFAKAGTYLFAGSSKPSWITAIATSVKVGTSTVNIGGGNNSVSVGAGDTATVTFTTTANTTGASRSWTYVVSSASSVINVVVTQPASTSPTTYTVIYKPGANGTGSQQTATKNRGVALTLKGALFTRANYAQKGWSMTDGGSKAYALGGSYTTDANVTLYPYWEATGTGGGGTEPTWNPVTKPDTVIVYARVYDRKSSAYLENADGLLAAFSSSGECRGKTALTQGPKSKLFQLTVGIESSSERGLKLKYWSASTGVVEIGETFDASAATIGSIAAPTTYYVGSQESVFTLSQGWTWVSVNVDPEDSSFASVFKGVSFANDDVIKSSDGSATYYGGTWYPSPTTFKLVAGRAYAVKKSTSGAATVKVSGTASATTKSVSAGWNWIGATSSDSAALSKLTHSAGFANDDVINASGTSATYYDGTWYGDLKSLVPGVGYKAKFAKAGTISFGK